MHAHASSDSHTNVFIYSIVDVAKINIPKYNMMVN